ncbi:hypothetical protein KP509_09G011800 [Ceratopteris richardii]|uniref:BHLH domain-containing protein n=1 Tax=Ceratopteris richardii TaxID=49495 RepID=A0A8T2U4L2_CERRI|nr:hypothetical protein KP509_09G011800 [Ceratopteris richardii]
MQQQALRSAQTGTSVVNGAGTQASSHRQPASVDVHSISSGNSSGNYHQQQKDETNDLTATSHMYTERRRRKRQRECFTKLRTLVPNIRKKDKVTTVVEHAITFIKELQNKVDKLETLISLKDEVSDFVTWMALLHIFLFTWHSNDILHVGCSCWQVTWARYNQAEDAPDIH